jgi:alkylation response protein AidB-like acyl-CoA dehydrogenase
MSPEERALLSETAVRLAAEQRRAGRGRTSASDRSGAAQWRRYAELGWLGIGVSIDFGGAGASNGDLIVLLEEVGSGLIMEPVLSTAIIAAGLIEALGDATQCARFLPQICEGGIKIALAYMEADTGFDRGPVHTCVSARGRGLCLTGRKLAVNDLEGADYLIVTARGHGHAGDTAAYIVSTHSPGISIAAARGIDDRSIGVVDLQQVEITAQDCLAASDVSQAIEATLDRATIGVCAEAQGAMRAAIDLTVEHLRSRRQFGRALSDFQSLRHSVADMKIAQLQARSMTKAAAEALDARSSIAPQLVSAAKIICDRAALFVGKQAVQLHGAMGLTEENVITHLDKRMLWATAQFGDVPWHLDRLCALPGIYQ